MSPRRSGRIVAHSENGVWALALAEGYSREVPVQERRRHSVKPFTRRCLFTQVKGVTRFKRSGTGVHSRPVPVSGTRAAMPRSQDRVHPSNISSVPHQYPNVVGGSSTANDIGGYPQDVA